MLLWISEAIDKGKISFSKLHEEESAAEAFLDWLTTFAPYLPPKLLPPEEDFQAFANYFASYLTTSFDMVEFPEYQIISLSGGICNCPLCLRLVQLSHLQVKNPRFKDKIEAEKKHIETLLALAQREQIEVSEAKLERILGEDILLKTSAYLAYAQSILDRMNGKSTGVYVLVLWRQIAWEPAGSPIHGFSLEVGDILDAERVMREAMRSRLEE